MTGWSAVIVVDDADGVREDFVVVDDWCFDQRGESEVKDVNSSVCGAGLALLRDGNSI